MAATRTVYRGAHGRFAGASAGKPEKVTSGGFHNAAFQARYQQMRASRAAARPPGTPSRRQPFPVSRRAQDKKALRMAGLVMPAALMGAGAGGLLAGGAVRGLGGPKMTVNAKLLSTAAVVAGAAGVQHNIKTGLKRSARAKTQSGRRIKR